MSSWKIIDNLMRGHCQLDNANKAVWLWDSKLCPCKMYVRLRATFSLIIFTIEGSLNQKIYCILSTWCSYFSKCHIYLPIQHWNPQYEHWPGGCILQWMVLQMFSNYHNPKLKLEQHWELPISFFSVSTVSYHKIKNVILQENSQFSMAWDFNNLKCSNKPQTKPNSAGSNIIWADIWKLPSHLENYVWTRKLLRSFYHSRKHYYLTISIHKIPQVCGQLPTITYFMLAGY